MAFCSHFRVPYNCFEDLVELVVRKGFYNPSRKDAVSRPCKNIGLLTLACLHHLGYGYPFGCIKRCVKISCTTLRVFFLHWCESLASLKLDYIYLPCNPEELGIVQGEYKAVGYPGCFGSIDAVKIGWDKCPHPLPVSSLRWKRGSSDGSIPSQLYESKIYPDDWQSGTWFTE